jgi:phosphoribosylglycinamide formyltransferase 1
MINLAVFASGSGTNAENIFNYFVENEHIKLELIVTNKINAGVINRTKNLGIDYYFISNKSLHEDEKILEILKKHRIDYIILAGFLSLIPSYLIKSYAQHIINIHPALLPKYGGKGMYGDNVHRAVLENHETESGITIHYVNEKYDEGRIILQARCPVYSNDTLETLSVRIHKLEYRYFPVCIEQVIMDHHIWD